MTTQDGGAWEKPSKWTRAKKNTNRALAGQHRNIHHRVVGPNRAIVYYTGKSRETGEDIRITEHHTGKTIPPSGDKTLLRLKNPRPLKLASGVNAIVFKSIQPSLVPARRIWPDRPGEARRVAEPVLRKWVKEVTARNFVLLSKRISRTLTV
jgi:hypothetical protein